MDITKTAARTALDIVEAAVSEVATDERESAVDTLRLALAERARLADQLHRVETFQARLAEFGGEDGAKWAAVLGQVLATR